MRLSMVLFIASICASSMSAQETKNEKAQTKMEAFVSKTGSMIKYIDTKLPYLVTKYTSCETRIREVIANHESQYFYQIEKDGKYKTKRASIAYDDLLELIKATEKLQGDVAADIASNPDYLENKFITDDGFKVGYFVDKGKASWYIELKKYESGDTFFIEDGAKLIAAFKEAKEKIESMK